MYTEKQYAEFRKLLNKATKEADEILKPRPAELSAKAKEVDEFLKNTDFGCYNEKVALAFTTLLGEPVGRLNPEPMKPIPKFSVVVPIKGNPNGHNYPMEKPVIIITYAIITAGIRPDGTIGNHLYLHKDYLRTATEAEIAELPKEQLDSALKEVVFIEA